jgi:hypothetical protein
MADTERARQLRKDETWAEKLMWRWLRGRRFSGYKFRRQHPIGIYYLDFFCEEAELNCAVMPRTSATRSSMSCSPARRIRCRNIHDR